MDHRVVPQQRNNRFMMATAFSLAIGFVFILEGIMPFLFPGTWRNAMTQIINQNDKTLRIYGLISMLIGLAWLYLNR